MCHDSRFKNQDNIGKTGWTPEIRKIYIIVLQVSSLPSSSLSSLIICNLKPKAWALYIAYL